MEDQPMARGQALRRLEEKLLARRRQLMRVVNGNMHEISVSNETGDDGDSAVNTQKTEVSSRLAELEDRELLRIQHALNRIKSGRYGLCEGCNAKIPAARLEAIPHTTLCVNCQRIIETDPERREAFEAGWAKSQPDGTFGGAADIFNTVS
jgi:RNA polymerase-binding transcription factor